MRRANLRLIGQTETDEPLQCPNVPLTLNGAVQGRGTNNFLKFCQSFRQLMLSRRMWTQLTLIRVVVWYVHCATLYAHSAKWQWHICWLRFYPRELQIVCARKSWQVGGVPSKVAEISCVGSLVKRHSVTTKCSQLRVCSVPNLKLLVKLHDVMSLELDREVRQCAKKLQVNKLLGKLSIASDMVSLEAKYHFNCLASLYSRTRAKVI